MAAAFLLLSCDLPCDQRGTLDRIASEKRLRVGLVENVPWVKRGPNGEPSGVEVELIIRFATDVGATPEWNWQNEPDAM